MTLVSLGANKKFSRLVGEDEITPAEVRAFERFEMQRYGYQTGFDLTKHADCQWLRGYRFARRELALKKS